MKKMIFIFGHLCTGKTTTIENVLRQTTGVFYVSFDRTKRLLAGFTANDKQFVREIVVDLLEVVAKRDVHILAEFFARNEEEYQKHLAIAQANGYELLCVYFTAPEDILITRFQERIKTRNDDPWRTVKDETKFLDKLHTRTFFMPEGTIIIDTSQKSPEETTMEIITLLER